MGLGRVGLGWIRTVRRADSGAQRAALGEGGLVLDLVRHLARAPLGAELADRLVSGWVRGAGGREGAGGAICTAAPTPPPSTPGAERRTLRPEPSTVLSLSLDSELVRSCESSRSQSRLSALTARDAVSLLSEMSLTPLARLAWGGGAGGVEALGWGVRCLRKKPESDVLNGGGSLNGV